MMPLVVLGVGAHTCLLMEEEEEVEVGVVVHRERCIG
jgi:hypothetical protein